MRLDADTQIVVATPEAPRAVQVQGDPVKWGSGEGPEFIEMGELNSDDDPKVFTSGISFQATGHSELNVADYAPEPDLKADLELEDVDEDKLPESLKARMEEEKAKADAEDETLERIEAEQRGEYTGATAPTAAAAAGAAPSPKSEKAEEPRGVQATSSKPSKSGSSSKS